MTIDTMFGGFKIIQSVLLTVSIEVIERKSWKERLWSWPWKPWQKTKIVQYQVPNPNAIRINLDTIVIHPATLQKLQQMARESK